VSSTGVLILLWYMAAQKNFLFFLNREYLTSLWAFVAASLLS
jgi:hypothetical protein